MPTPILNKFPQDHPNRIVLPGFPAQAALDQMGLSSRSVPFQAWELKYDPNAVQDDPNRFDPIAAVALESPPAVGPSVCASGAEKYFLNQCMSRCGFWLMNMTLAGGSALPAVVQFQVRQSCGCGISTKVRFDGSLTFDVVNDKPQIRDLIVQVGGLLSEQTEFWAFIPFDPIIPTGFSMHITLYAVFDRFGDINQAIKGPASLVTGTLL